MPPRGVILPKWVATEFAHFCCRYLISGYHDTLILTNLGALTWEACLPLAFLYSDQDTSKRAGLVFLSAVGNFYAAATTRFNDSGFTSGLSFLLPPFFCYNFLLIYVLGPPTMILGGVICGRAIVLTQGLGPAVIGGTGLVVVGWFFRDVHEWMPFLGWMGGAGSSEGFDSSFLRAGLYPATFAVAFVLAELTASLFSHWLLQSCGIACVIMVFAYQAKVRLVCFP
ncbi:unnamed protein product [Durusdinium trenchii]|uniref:Actin-regulating kinase 1 n=2 Tax=Durusdinium trenchii TaxID=1381693 RepID=A0ABP0RAB4_9DINO